MSSATAGSSEARRTVPGPGMGLILNSVFTAVYEKNKVKSRFFQFWKVTYRPSENHNLFQKRQEEGLPTKRVQNAALLRRRYVKPKRGKLIFDNVLNALSDLCCVLTLPNVNFNSHILYLFILFFY